MPAGWSPDWGYHDFGASGLVHMVSGFFALGVLIHLGPRIGKFNADGSANVIRGHSLPMTMVGLMLIVVGFFGFLGGCVVFPGTGNQLVRHRVGQYLRSADHAVSHLLQHADGCSRRYDRRPT